MKATLAAPRLVRDVSHFVSSALIKTNSKRVLLQVRGPSVSGPTYLSSSGGLKRAQDPPPHLPLGWDQHGGRILQSASTQTHDASCRSNPHVEPI